MPARRSWHRAAERSSRILSGRTAMSPRVTSSTRPRGSRASRRGSARQPATDAKMEERMTSIGDEARQPAEAIAPEALPAGPRERFAYSYGVRAGRMLWISGQVALNAEGAIVGVGDVGTQAAQAFDN